MTNVWFAQWRLSASRAACGNLSIIDLVLLMRSNVWDVGNLSMALSHGLAIRGYELIMVPLVEVVHLTVGMVIFFGVRNIVRVAAHDLQTGKHQQH